MLRKTTKLSVFFSTTLFLIVTLQASAQDMVYETEGGTLKKDFARTVQGVRTGEVFDVFNKIPFINSPKGYDVHEGRNVMLSADKRIYKAFFSIGFPRLYRYKKGKLEKQGEFAHIYLYANDVDMLMEQSGRLFPTETGNFNLPQFFIDTPSITYTPINGTTVGISKTWNNFGLYILNPLQTPLFKPLTKEVFAKFWIRKLQSEIEVEQRHLKEKKADLNRFSADPALHALIPDTKTGISINELWINYYEERKSYYEQKLQSMSASEKKEPALGCEPKTQPVAQIKGSIVEKLTGYLSGELADDIKEAKAYPIFQYNTSFFNPQLPKSAIQLLVIQQAGKLDTKDAFTKQMETEVYPHIDFKALTTLMYK